MSANLENPAVATGLEKIHISVPKKGSTKECSNHQTIALISHASKIMLKILQARLQHYVNWEFPDVQAGFRKGRGTRDQLANIHWITKKAREFQKKHLTSISFDYTKTPLTLDHNKLWKTLRDENTRQCCSPWGFRVIHDWVTNTDWLMQQTSALQNIWHIH